MSINHCELENPLFSDPGGFDVLCKHEDYVTYTYWSVAEIYRTRESHIIAGPVMQQLGFACTYAPCQR